MFVLKSVPKSSPRRLPQSLPQKSTSELTPIQVYFDEKPIPFDIIAQTSTCNQEQLCAKHTLSQLISVKHRCSTGDYCCYSLSGTANAPL